MSSGEPTHVRKILLLEANPNGTVHLRLTKELRRIIDSRKQSNERDRFELIIETAVTTAHIQQALLEHQPEIVHFCGHGAGPDGIVCEDESGEIKLISNAALGHLFKLVKRHVRCVFLNACDSVIQANEIVKSIEYVVCMQSRIGDQAALKLAEGFYVALFAGRDFPDCFQWGVNKIKLAGIPEDSVPTLKTNKRARKTVQPSYIPPVSGPPPVDSASMPRQISKRDYLSLIVIVFLTIALITTSLRKEEKTASAAPPTPCPIVGHYIQETVDKNQNWTETTDYIRWYEVNTDLFVSSDPHTGKCVALESSKWKIYYSSDPQNAKKDSFVTMSFAQVLHKEYYRQGDKIIMSGDRTKGRVPVEVEPLFGPRDLVEKIRKGIEADIESMKRYAEVKSAWTQDQAGHLTKEKWYPNNNTSKPEDPERFIRQN